ncbi:MULTISPECIES: hypothetical protein [Hyphomonas]|uniref:hypothetical protein n=1 Tax=Hyphomonas TaxID=85 RepID=UPI0035154C65
MKKTLFVLMLINIVGLALLSNRQIQDDAALSDLKDAYSLALQANSNLEAKLNETAEQIADLRNTPVTLEDRVIDSIRAKKIEVFGENGNALIELSSNGDVPYQNFNTSRGDTNISIVSSESSGSAIQFWDEKQVPRLRLGTLGSIPHLVMWNAAETERVAMYANEDASALSLVAPEGNVQSIQLSASDELNRITIIHPKNKAAAGIISGDEGIALAFLDDDRRVRVVFGINNENWSVSAVYSDNGELIFGVGGREPGEFLSYVYRTAGQEAWNRTTDVVTLLSIFGGIRSVFRR